MDRLRKQERQEPQLLRHLRTAGSNKPLSNQNSFTEAIATSTGSHCLRASPRQLKQGGFQGSLAALSSPRFILVYNNSAISSRLSATADVARAHHERSADAGGPPGAATTGEIR
jgi:hypothetical protein